MKSSPFLLSCILGALMTYPSFVKAQSTTMQHPSLNMIAYEHKTADQYATVLYMPYYPAYGMISLKSPDCNAEIAGYIDPFALTKKKLIITYKTCKISFNLEQNNQILSTPTETITCQEYHPKNCNFSQIPSLQRISLGTTP